MKISHYWKPLVALAAIVAAFALTFAFEHNGLDLNIEKCELIPKGPVFDRELFPADLSVVNGGDFELLGAPIGSDVHCAAHTHARVEKAQPLLDAIAQL